MILEGERNEYAMKFHKIWLICLSVFIIFGPFAALGHVSYLLWTSDTWGTIAMVISIIFGYIFWLWAIFVWYASIDMTLKPYTPSSIEKEFLGK